MGIQRVFCSQVDHQKLLQPRSNLFQELISECDIIRRQDRQGVEWSKTHYPNGYTSYGSMDRLHELSPHFGELGKKIEKRVNNYVKSLGLKLKQGDLRLTRMWMNVMGKGCSHPFHIHPLSVVSGTFYLKTPEGSAPIKFEDPRFANFMNRPEVNRSSALELKPFVEIKPRPGDLVLFESWMKHEVPVNLRAVERQSISFNFDW